MSRTDKLLQEYEKKKKAVEQSQNQLKTIEKKLKEQQRKADTKRKIEKGGAFESFEKEITGKQEQTTSDDVVHFLRYVFSKEDCKNKLKEITNQRLQKAENRKES